MKHLFASLAFVAFASFSATAQNAAEISFESETVNYGKIEKNADGKREFTFTNTGKEPLIITNCVGSCGCTVPQWPKTPIAPGATASIKVKYDTRRVGRFQKTVTVQSNASKARTVLTMIGEVLLPAANNTAPVKIKAAGSKISK